MVEVIGSVKNDGRDEDAVDSQVVDLESVEPWDVLVDVLADQVTDEAKKGADNKESDGLRDNLRHPPQQLPLPQQDGEGDDKDEEDKEDDELQQEVKI